MRHQYIKKVKLITFIIGIFLFNSLSAQIGSRPAAPIPGNTDDDTTYYTKWGYTPYGIKMQRMYPTKSLRTPKDTIYTKAGLAILSNDTALWYGDEIKWRRLVSGTGTWAYPVDSSALQYLSKLNDSTVLFHRWKGSPDTLVLNLSGSGGGTGDMILASAQTNSGAKTFLDNTMLLRNVANTFNGRFTNTNTADRIYTLKDAAGTLAFTSDITGTNSGTNTGDQTITLTGGVTGGGTGTFAATVVTNANLTGPVTSTGNATAIAAGAISNTMLANGAVANLSGTNTGDQTTITGNAGTATNLQTSRNINGTAFNGSVDITITAAAGTLTGATLAAGVTASSLTTVGTLASPTLTTPVINGVITGTGQATAATASTITMRNANANVLANNFLQGYTTTATAAGTTTLTVGSTYLQFFTGSTTQTVTLPVVSTLALGHQFYVRNNSTGAVTINSSGGNAIIILAGNTRVMVTSIATTGTDATVWSAMYMGIGIATGKRLAVSNTITLAGTDATTMTFPSASTTIVGTDATQTLTNKRRTLRAPSITQSATPTINTDNTDVAHITGLAQAITSMTTNLTGTPVEGDELRIDITDNATARVITWGASFEDGAVTLPILTVISSRLDVKFFWNTATSKWRAMAKSY